VGSCHEEVSTQIKEARLARKGTGDGMIGIRRKISKPLKFTSGQEL